MNKPLDDETASSRLKQVGMMTVLYDMHIGNKPLTVANITETTGLTRGGVDEAVAFLVLRGLLVETKTTNSMGRGRARLFHIPESIFDRLRHFDNV
ncbi:MULTISPECIES: MarR family transcriptional regulator [unclassified Aureimonas]|uniref:MarR family transcriptional regulator n=1 Tax=unclassified Aureimonas TaxID=2615206 RepID=UPI002A4E22EC|nr:MarR family transcriptional regulator [Aureimonas sp. Leaf427]